MSIKAQKNKEKLRIKKLLSSKIKEYCKKNNLTAVGFANTLYVSKTTAHRLLSCTINPFPRKEMILKIAKIVNIDEETLNLEALNIKEKKYKFRKNYKLTDEEVIEIYLNTEHSNNELARKYNVTNSIISRIRSGKRRKKITKNIIK